MKFMRIVSAAVFAAASGLAQAAPVDLGDGPGSYTFSGNHDQGFFVTLGPGTYTFTSEVSAVGFDLIEVWLSYSKDHKSSNGNDIDVFDEINPTLWTESYGPLVLTQTTDVFVDVNTLLGKKSQGSFDGTLIITAVPEPASGLMLLAGASALLLAGRRRLR